MHQSKTLSDAGRIDGPVALAAIDRAIVQWLAAGLTNKEIARQVGRSAETVKARLARLMRRAGARSRTELAIRLLGGG